VRAPGAVVIGGHVNGLGLVRALAARRVPTAVVTTKPYDFAHRSRWSSSHERLLEIEEQPEGLLEVLERRGSEWSGWALIPTNDGALAALARLHDRLSSRYRVVAPPWEVAGILLDKQRMLEAAQAVGLALPRCYGPAVETTAACPDLSFPVVVKPIAGHLFFTRFGCKLFVATDAAELRRAIARLAAAGLAGQVLDLIPGADSRIYAYCTYIDASGEPVGGMTVRKLRQAPPFYGVARVAEVADDRPELRDATLELLRRIGFRGIAAAEFKHDPRDGSFRFIEVNGRSVVYNALLRRAGLDLGWLAWSDHVHGRPEERARWVHLHADLLYSTLYRRHDPVGVADFLAPYARPRIDAVWSPRDPLPAFVQWSQTAREVASALWQGTHALRLADPSRSPAPDRAPGSAALGEPPPSSRARRAE